ncbi:conserved hypothetical protein [Ahrensia sp. R2A130]|nr:conserved hypothetical protein [Ahrensia sp. R2A130]
MKFLTAMITDSERLNGWRRPFSRVLAHLFYMAVRLFGWMTYGTRA